MSNASDSKRPVDTDRLKQKYALERQKRLRPEQDTQYLEASGELGEFATDPYIDEPIVRDSVSEDIEVAIIGGGFAGLLSAVELEDRGISDFRIIEQAGDFGGTWYWNRYPGIRCDIESYVYMPLLEEVGTIPTERYASGLEIFEHAKAIGRHFDLYDRSFFQTKVESIKWNDDLARWIVSTNRGDTFRARYVMVGQGPLAKIKLPGIPGLKSFKGKMFHSARWDYDYTGGDVSGGLSKLADKRVAVIGTGATAVQIVPKLARDCKELLVFQRTPSALAPRNNSPTDADWFARQPKGWQQARIDNFLTNITPGAHPKSDVVNDGWTDFFKRVGARMGAAKHSGQPFDPNEVFQEVDFEKMEELRARIPEKVRDSSKAEAIMPWYNYLCKRPLFSDDYLECLDNPAVKVIDTDGQGVSQIDETGVVANGQHYEVDCIIFATGFDVGADAHKVGGYELTGRGGISLDEYWAEGRRTVLGTQMHRFPNFHIVGATEQGSTAFNYTHILSMQARHAAEIIDHCRKAGAVCSEVTREAEDRWLEKMQKKHAIDLTKYFFECTPGFLNNEGNVHDKSTFLGGTYGGGTVEYEKLMIEWRATQLDRDLELKTAPPQQVAEDPAPDAPTPQKRRGFLRSLMGSR